MNQTVLITGAARRIGKAMAEHLASRGWDVILHFNSSATEAAQLVAGLSAKYPLQKFGIANANLSKSGEAGKLIPSVVEGYGSFNLLVNNASVFEPGLIAGTSARFLERQLNINFKAPFILMRDFQKYCREGIIVNMVDTRITSNKTDFAAYSLSKKMLWELTKMAAFEFAPAIRVNAIAPGLILAPDGKDEDYLIRLAQKIPMRQPGGVGPVLKCLGFILSNGYLTGQLLFADGGENLGNSGYNQQE